MNPSIQKFNSTANTFSVLGKLIDKSLSQSEKEIGGTIVCEIADLLIKEIQDIKESFGCTNN